MEHAPTSSTTPRDLYESLRPEAPTRLLDVRNAEEFARWRVEGPGRVDMLNVPYFEFVEAEEDSVAKVRRFLGDAAGGPFFVVCAKGGSSEYVADLLRGRGFDARNVEGGMEAWGAATVERPLDPSLLPADVRAWQIQRFGKGCLSYVVAAGDDAVVVDPHRRIDDYRAFLDAHRLTPRAVFDTHLHADHLTGGPGLAAAAASDFYAGPADFAGATFPYLPATDGATVRLGALAITPLRFLGAPGHTPGSTALLVGERLLLTGDTLFVGSVGRPDLAGKAAEWGRDLHATLHRRLAGVPDAVLVLPAHTAGPREIGAGGLVAAPLGRLRRESPAMRADEAAFLRQVEEGMRPAPEAYAVIRALNLGARRADDAEQGTLELGKNECALERH